MASEAVTLIAQEQQRIIKQDYGGVPSNRFVSDVKQSALFQFNWGELLSAAPTALSLMGSCWIAASAPVADQIVLTKAVPVGGFKYITNRSEPTLRSCLVDVCNNGGRAAFTLASANMEALKINATRICDDRIKLVFQLLLPCTEGEDQLEDFKDALEYFASDARMCAKLATETREAFSLWGKMVGELHAATEQQKGQTAIERDTSKVAENIAKIDQSFAVNAEAAAKDNVASIKAQLARAEKRLDASMDKVPGPWESVVQGAVTGITQAIPSLIAGALPMVMAGSNPMGAVAMAATGAAKSGAGQANGATNPQIAGIVQNVSSAVVQAAEKGVQAAQQAQDPAYPAAKELTDLVNHFFEFLGGDKGTVDWTKFEEPKEDITAHSGTSYLVATLTNRKKETVVTNSEPNTKLHSSIDNLIKTAEDIATAIKGQTDLSSSKVADKQMSAWKSDVREARKAILSLSASAPTPGSGNMPLLPDSNVKINVPKTDLSAQNAQLSSAMQGVQIAQNAVELAQSSYDAAVKKQAETQRAMAEVEKRLKSLQEKGKTLPEDEIKVVLRDCINVLVDLTIQIGKLEKFFTMLTTIIDQVVMPQAQLFNNEMLKAGDRAAKRKYIQVDDVKKQVIFGSVLQVKAYFSLLADIGAMYGQVDRDYILRGMELCDRVSTPGQGENLAQELANYSRDSAKAVADVVSKKQDEMLKGLKDRARKALDTSETIQNTVRNKGLSIDTAARSAIEDGAAAAIAKTETMVQGNTSATVLNDASLM